MGKIGYYMSMGHSADKLSPKNQHTKKPAIIYIFKRMTRVDSFALKNLKGGGGNL